MDFKRLLVGGLAALVLAFAALPAMAGGTFAVINNLPDSTDNNVRHAYIYRNSPGTDQFKSGGYIIPGDHVEFKTSISGCGGFKLKLKIEDGTSYTANNINVCGRVYSLEEDGLRLTDLDLDEISIDNADLDRHITFYNYYGSSIVEIYATNTKDGDWGRDLLVGSKRIRPDAEATLKLDDRSGQCAYDVRMVANDGEEWRKMGFNVCSEASLEIPF